jgi:cytochrome c biogenesis protein CcdA
MSRRAVVPLLFIALLLTQNVFAAAKISLNAYSVDLGNVEEGRNYPGKVIVTNVGDDNLEVVSSTSCGCVKVIEPKGKFTLAPKDSIEVNFDFNTSGYSGKVKRDLILNTNDPTNPVVIAKVFCNVKANVSNLISRLKSLNIWMIVSTGLADSINPCAFTVLVFFISFLVFIGYKKKEIFFVGGLFILTVFVTYLLLGFGIFNTFKSLGVYYILQIGITLVTMIFAFVLAVMNVYDFIIFKKTNDPQRTILKLPGVIKKKIQNVIRDNIDIREKTGHSTKSFLGVVISTVGCAFLVTLLESVCTGQMYLPIIVYLTVSAPSKLVALYYLMLYNLVFVLPLAVIVVLGALGVNSETFAKFAQKNLGTVKIITALIFLVLAITLLIWKKEDFLYFFTFLF